MYIRWLRHFLSLSYLMLGQLYLGIGCGSVGRYSQFESSHLHTLYYLYTVNCIEKAKIKCRDKELTIF